MEPRYAQTSPWRSAYMGLATAAFLAAVILLSDLGSTGHLVAGIAFVLTPLWSLLLYPTESLWLEADQMVEKRRGRVTRLDLHALASVSHERGLRTEVLAFEDQQLHRIHLSNLGEETAALRRAIGSRLKLPSSAPDLRAGKVRTLLYLDDDSGLGES